MSMTIPFLNFLKKVKDQAFPKKELSGGAKKHASPLEKPSSERFSKTVMPNTTRTLPPQDPFEAAARSHGSPTGGVSGSSSSRTIAFGPTPPGASRPTDLPPAVALALEPMV